MNLSDHEKLPSVKITRSDQPFYFTEVKQKPLALEMVIDSLLSGSTTGAFLFIRNDSLLYEKYFMGFNSNSLLPSNSIAKSFTGTLVGIAIDEGKILSTLEPMTNYIPELKKKDAGFERITIQHLLDMRSGLLFNDASYTLTSDAVRMGLKRNLVKQLFKIKIEKEPGIFNYQSVNTQFLSLILERATGKPLQALMEEKLWKNIGTEHDASMNVDSRRHKHAYGSAGLNATARDFAKLGRLYLNNGTLNGKEIISRGWVELAANADSMHKYDGYKNQWWNKRVASNVDIAERHSYKMDYPTPAYNAFGFLEQILYIHPAKNILIVRIGKHWPKEFEFTQAIYDLGERF